MSHESEPIRIERPLAWVSVGAMITDRLEERLLLVQQRETDQWGLPAGGLNLEELVREALEREVGEETGLNPGEVEFSNTCSVITVPGEHFQEVGLIFRGRTLQEKFRPRKEDEIAEVRLFSQRELGELLRAPEEIYRPEFNATAIRAFLEERLAWDLVFTPELARALGVRLVAL